ncbi:hypothetical protein BKA63DRAFT_32582 [Paraphoma chrysanthemicola]|nr:hypothetical protein BKA63DRAFT_32582 [Paraphoma chrysanthemicola]
MDSLPIELISCVAEQLEQYEVFQLQRWSFINMEDPRSTVDCAGWLVHTTNSRRDLGNFRLTCRTMYSASLPAFGRLLGSRTFRKSRIGLQDLEGISSSTHLRPHVRTLAFGTAEFVDPTYSAAYNTMFSKIPEPDRSRLIDAYDIEYSWEFLNNYHEDHSTYREDLSAVLLNFPNLGEVRLSDQDFPVPSGHLGQWLGPGDKAIVNKALKFCQPWEDQSLYRCGNYDSLRSIAEALRDAATKVRVLQLGKKTNIQLVATDPSGTTNDIFSTLSKLSLSIDPETLYDTDWVHSHNPFSFFARLSNITELSISKGPPKRYHVPSDHTSVFHTLLRPLTRLKALTIQASWYFPRAELVALVSSHSTSLTNFTLTGAMISRDALASALQNILALSMPQMRHMELSNMVDTKYVGDYTRDLWKNLMPTFDDADWQDFVNEVRPSVEQHASYAVILSSGKNKYTFHPQTPGAI